MNRIIFKKVGLLFLIPVFKLLNLFEFNKKKPGAMVVFYPGKLGDIVCLSSVFENLKKAYPESAVVLIARSPFIEILSGNPYIDHVIGFSSDKQPESLGWLLKARRFLKKYRLDFYFNLIANFEGGVLGHYLKTKSKACIVSKQYGVSHRIVHLGYTKKVFDYSKQIKECYFDLLEESGIKVVETKNKLFFDQEDPEEVKKFVRENDFKSGDLVVGLLVSSGKDFKQWPLDHWAGLGNLLAEKLKAKVLFFGLPGELDSIQYVVDKIEAKTYQLIGVSLKILPYYLKKCNLLVGVDTGLIYIADALGVPVVNIMGNWDTRNQRPENRYRLVTNPGVCRIFVQTPTEPNIHKYGKEIADCFKSIEPTQVFEECKLLLS